MALREYDGKFNISDFKAFIRNNDVVRTNQFEVFIPNLLDGPEIMLCESASIPGISILTKNVKYLGPAYQRGLSIDYGGAGISMTFVIDGNTRILQIFNDWIHRSISKQFFVRYDEDYKKNMYIGLLRKDGINEPPVVQTTKDGKPVAGTDLVGKKMELKRIAPAIYGVKIYEAFPIALSPILLDTTPGSGIAKLNVTFAYKRWEEDLLPEQQKVDVTNNEILVGAGTYTQKLTDTLGIAKGGLGSLGEGFGIKQVTPVNTSLSSSSSLSTSRQGASTVETATTTIFG